MIKLPYFCIRIFNFANKMNTLNLRAEIQNKGRFLCVNDDFYIFDVAGNDLSNHPFKIDMYICCICLQGESIGKINLLPHHMSSSKMSINVSGQILEQISISDDFKGICIFMSNDFINSLGLPYNFQTYMLLQDNPVLDLQSGQLEAMISYCTMVRKVIENKHPYQLDVIRHLTCAFFYGMGYYFHEISKNKILSNDEALMDNFSKEVQLFYRKERKVLYYADRLHLSAGYLSTIIKRVSGKTAAEWIDDYVTLEAKALLKSTNLTIQQISDELNFPSQSFFGKYFKRITGLSPKEYREKN